MDAPNGERGELLERRRGEVEVAFSLAARAAIRDPDGHRLPIDFIH